MMIKYRGQTVSFILYKLQIILLFQINLPDFLIPPLSKYFSCLHTNEESQSTASWSVNTGKQLAWLCPKLTGCHHL